MEREEGYYWVQWSDGDWAIMLWNTRGWLQVGDDEFVNEDFLKTIDPTPITRNENEK